MALTPADDPRPEPPEKPLPGDCCGNGCAVCVLETYAQARIDYEAALAQWRARHPQDASG